MWRIREKEKKVCDKNIDRQNWCKGKESTQQKISGESRVPGKQITIQYRVAKEEHFQNKVKNEVVLFVKTKSSLSQQ